MNNAQNTTTNATSDYSIFENASGNRPISIPQVNRLRRSMYEYGFLKSFPVSCVRGESGKLKITDGQHRFEAAKLLGLEVYYIVEKMAVDPSVIPTQKKWTIDDYLVRYAATGNDSYQSIMNVSKTYGVSTRTALVLLTNDIGHNKADSFRSGKSALADNYRSGINAIRTAKACVEINKNLLINPLALTLFRLSTVEVINYLDALKRIESHADQMLRFNSVDRGLDEVEKAYNFRLRTELRVPIAMIVKQKMALAQRTFGRTPKQ